MADPFSLTQTVLASDPVAYKSATQSSFLTRAAEGRVSKDYLGKWLSNDRLYIHGYIRGVGRLLSFLQLPETVEEEADVSESTRLLHWMIDALVNIRREEEFFVRTAADYGISLDVSHKLEGLRRFEALFDSTRPGDGDREKAVLPWLESAIVFWATEKCYLDAWSGASARLSAPSAADGDEDGGALRREFIPNWSSVEFARFVDQLGEIVDSAVRREMELRQDEGGEEAIKEELLDRALVKWREVLVAEKAFWPAME
ncbi:hypothetical protein TGAMA5MH_09232 [Trichoderma gamsii]|uniref:Thiaminase-2/PQQC domain-containing protein n=1 Tax=Trichoderma gamsii TaxID=398673 RepID=A0A0W7VV47_9HYPO|nr:hypothetical protein TGAMA5MH_09232 [Trichoderma gamsii]